MTVTVDVGLWGTPNDLSDVLAVDFSRRLVTGEHPAVVYSTIHAGSAAVLAALTAQGLAIDRVVSSRSLTIATLSNHRAAAVIRCTTTSCDLAVSAADRDSADTTARAVADAVGPGTATPDELDVSLWYAARTGYEQLDRRIVAPSWPSARINYPGAVRSHLDALNTVVRPSTGGRLVLMHGAPGTGKTTAIRSLLRSWAPWCDAHYVTDPERLFADAGYLWEVVAHESDPEDDTVGRWRVIVAEDSDEFLRTSARQEAGAAMGRLLNFTDGVMGQGSNTVVVITTNERLDRLHPAVIRPGRCLAQIEFAPFTPDEAATWLGSGATPPARSMTLAELFAQQNGAPTISTEPILDAPFGTYL